MTDKKISQLDAAATLDGTELVELVQSGANKRTTAQALADLARGGGVSITLNSAPADGDIDPGELILWFDSTNGASKLVLKGKSANGTVVSGDLGILT